MSRNGMHHYDNQDHAMLSAIRSVARSFGENVDPWRVNTDIGYHEIGLLQRRPADAAAKPQYSAAVGYPENVLATDEHVVLHRHPHWGRLTIPALILIIASAAAAFVAGYVDTLNWERNAKNIVFAVIAAIWLILVGWLSVWPFLNWRTTHFVITDRRVMYRHGMLTRSGIDIPLARINSVEFRHGLVARMLRTGMLIIESASQDPLEFQDIPRVEHVHSLLYHEVFDILGSEEAPN